MITKAHVTKKATANRIHAYIHTWTVSCDSESTDKDNNKICGCACHVCKEDLGAGK